MAVSGQSSALSSIRQATDVSFLHDRVIFPDETGEEADDVTIHIGVVAHI